MKIVSSREGKITVKNEKEWLGRHPSHPSVAKSNTWFINNTKDFNILKNIFSDYYFRKSGKVHFPLWWMNTAKHCWLVLLDYQWARRTHTNVFHSYNRSASAFSSELWFLLCLKEQVLFMQSSFFHDEFMTLFCLRVTSHRGGISTTGVCMCVWLCVWLKIGEYCKGCAWLCKCW